MKTLQEKFNAIKEDRFTKAQFLRDVRLSHPNLVTQFNGFDDAVRILKNRGMIVEAKEKPIEYEEPVHVYEQDRYSLDTIMRAVDTELKKKGIDPVGGGVTEDEYQKAQTIALRNLAKDKNYYLHYIANTKPEKDHRSDGLEQIKHNAANQMAKAVVKEHIKKIIVKILSDSADTIR